MLRVAHALLCCYCCCFASCGAETQHVPVRFSFGEQLCGGLERFVSYVQCENSNFSDGLLATDAHSQVWFCAQDDLRARNVTYWTWQAECELDWSAERKALLQSVRLLLRSVAGRRQLRATLPHAATNSCSVEVQPVLRLALQREAASPCDVANGDGATELAQTKRTHAAMYKPLVGADGSTHVTVTYVSRLTDGRWLLSCLQNQSLQPAVDACVDSVTDWGETVQPCDLWLRYDRESRSVEHGSATLTHNASQFTVYEGQFYTSSDYLYVCEATLLEPEETDDWHRLVERSLFIISAIADLANILVHLTLRAQRTLPGRIVLCLSSTLFASDLSCFLLTFLRSVETLWVCFALRSVAHYLSLCASCWTQVLWYDLWLTISASRTVDSCRHLHSRFYRYVIFSWIVPILFPATRLVVDVHSTLYLPPSDDDIDLQRLTVCNQQPLMYYLTFSAIPVSCILVMNTVFLTRSCCLIRRVVLDTERVGISNTFMNAQMRFGLYTKLFFLCGFTSLFGFVTEILKHQNASESLTEVLARVSGILDSSLGLCVSLPFLCEPRVGIRFVRAVLLRRKPQPTSRLAKSMKRDGPPSALCNHV